MKLSFKQLVFLFAFSFTIVSGQQLRFKYITSENGLSTNFVRCIMQDERGFIWFGTQDGLNKYDGFEFKVFKNQPTDKNSLKGVDIVCMLQVSPGLVVVGTDNGPHFFNPVTEKFSRLQKADKRLEGKITAIYKADNSTVLLGTEEGLYLVDIVKREVLRPVFEAGNNISVKCLQQFNGDFIVGTNGQGLWKFRLGTAPQKLVAGDKKLAAATANVSHLEVYEGKLYAGTFGSGILRFDAAFKNDRAWSFAAQNPNSDFITDFTIKGDRIFAATEYGVIVHDIPTEQTGHYYKKETPGSVNANPCTSIHVDLENNCWVGTQLGGINVAFSRALKFPVSAYNYETRFADVFSFYEIRPGHVMVGGLKTFDEVDLLTGKIKSHSGFLGNGTALCITRENETIYWVGTWGNGIYRYDIETGAAKNFLEKETGGTIVHLRIEGEYLYAGSVGDGLFKIHLKTFETTRFTEQEGLPNASINAIYKDMRGRVWLGTYDGGLVRMSGFDKDGKLPIDTIYRNTGLEGQIASNIIFDINEDKNGNLWVATSSGLSKLKSDGSFRNFYEKDGLANAYLFSLLKDSLGHFWASSNAGISRFNPLLPEKDMVFKNYSTKDGLVNTEFTMGAARLSASGQMYFGGTKGFNTFRPSQIKDNRNAPAVYVIGFKRGGKDVITDSLILYKKHLDLKWRENYFQFELAALDYTDPAKNRFSYMLEGYDADWSSPTTVRYVSYTELPGGDYTFKVKATNSDGTWNEKPFEITITVVPPFWKTRTFYALMILLCAGGVVAFTQYRTRTIKKENKVLEAKVAERTKELHEKNLDITSSIEYARRIQEAILPSKDHIFSHLRKAFILYRPKDIVSGDFYWFGEKNKVKIFAVVDCTGHGVPGAFMSMIGHNLLNQIIMEKAITDPGDILNHLHRGIQAALRQGHNEISTNDGMDVSMLTVDGAGEVQWAGANRPLVLIDPEKNFSRLEGDKFPVGGAQAYVNRLFTTKKVVARPGTMAYMFSDGYADQFGGDRGKKFMVKRLHETLTAIHHLDAVLQKEELEKQFLVWKAAHEQVDDVLVAGIEL